MAGLVCFFGVKAFLILAIITAKIICLGFLVSYASKVALIMQISSILSLFRFRFSIRYRVSIRFRFRFFKYSFYSGVLVPLVLLYTKFKLLLSLRRYSS